MKQYSLLEAIIAIAHIKGVNPNDITYIQRIAYSYIEFEYSTEKDQGYYFINIPEELKFINGETFTNID